MFRDQNEEKYQINGSNVIPTTH